tara:strand:- start:2080 stop:2829 length:750 start_codon:yes stop_codon:yes gene_type:complete
MVKTRIIKSEPILILEGEKKYLVITDLHIGFENEFASNKIEIGKNSSVNETIEKLKKVIKIEKPDSVILLGDTKSSIKRISKTEWKEIPHFFEEIKKESDLILIPGNHDANIQQLIPHDVITTNSIGLVIDDTLLTHGHALPTKNFSNIKKIIMGHIHPVFFNNNSLLNGERVWISLKAKKDQIFSSSDGEIEITIMPSFNPYFYATQKKLYKKSISPIIKKLKSVSEAKIVTLDGTIIGNESILEDLI